MLPNELPALCISSVLTKNAKNAFMLLMHTYENWLLSDEGKTRIVTINRPAVLNALNKSTLLELEILLREINDNQSIRSVIITGSGEKSFIAGADISEMKELTPIEAEELSALGHRVLDYISHMRMPVIAAVNGFALGGGLELALACDFIYASENAVLGLVETKLGLIPGFGGIARLTRRVGSACAREMIYTAATINSQEAYRIGLVNQVSSDVVAAAIKTSETIASRGPYAIGLVKGLVRDGQDADWRSANAMEQRGFGLVFSTNDRARGVTAFLEKKTPSFEGN